MVSVWVLLMFLSVAVWLTAVAAGILMVRSGLRGIEVDDHPRCIACGYDLSCWEVRPTRCSECGVSLLGPRRIKLGRYRTNVALSGAGIAVLLVCLAIPTHLWVRSGQTIATVAPAVVAVPQPQNWGPTQFTGRRSMAVADPAPWTPPPPPSRKMAKAIDDVLEAIGLGTGFVIALSASTGEWDRAPHPFGLDSFDPSGIVQGELGGQLAFGAGPDEFSGGEHEADRDADTDTELGGPSMPGTTRFSPGTIDVTPSRLKLDGSRPGKPRNHSITSPRYESAPRDTRYRPR